MILRKISWIAVLFTLVMTLSSNISLAENEGTECENKFCIPPINKGNQGFFSRVINRIDGTPPNTEHLKSSANMGQPFSISIDGNPTSNNANVTRKKDIALSKGDIQVRFDGLKNNPVLNLTVEPDAAVRGETVTFTPYTNFAAFITKAELRVFAENESIQKTPLAIIKIDNKVDQSINWKTPYRSELNSLQYVLRVYDKEGRFNETFPKKLRLVDEQRLLGDETNKKREELIGYGENHLSIKNIPTAGGSITINGDNLKPGSTALAMGRTVLVDNQGKFAYQQIIPAGDHSINVVTTESNGRRSEFNRSIYIPSNDWFYIVHGDLTVGKNSVTGPIASVTGNNTKRYSKDSYTEGRLAFYTKGKIKQDWQLTASADTREQPFEDLFTNFSKKDSRYLLKRLDSNIYYPTYGDDSTAIEDAPTQGKFFIKLEKDDSKIMWGNFQTQSTGTDLFNYSRVLYGANASYLNSDTTKFGERKIEVNGFAADPGSQASLEEFRGTGGSLYYLRAQDIVVGSERIRIEIRDKDSNIVMQTKNLVYGQDYEINYLQGRIILREPLSTYSANNSVVATGTLSGNPTYLIVGYEYVPGLTAIQNFTKGGRASYWLNDHIKVGITTYQQNGIGTKQELKGADTTLRYAAGTYLKIEAGKSDGPGIGALSSPNGGFNFSTMPQSSPNKSADAYRIETAIDLAEISNGMAGKLGAYVMNRGDGFSSPGQLTNEKVNQSGLTGHLPIGEKVSIDAKADLKNGQNSGIANTGEVAANYKMTVENTLTLAVRNDNRMGSKLSAGQSLILAERGSRTDGTIKLNHAPLNDKGEKERYEVYGLAQATLARAGGRSLNNRGGAGGRYDLNDRTTLTGESTAGNGGWGGKAGAEYRASDRTSYYSNYALDTERSDIGYRGRNSTLTSGAKSRYSDTLSMFTEQRYHNFNRGPAGLIHAFGLDLAANDRWTWGSRFEKGKVSDPTTGDLNRTAASLTAGYNHEKTKYSGTVEWRKENGRVIGNRISWLMKNKLLYQTTPNWRFLSNLDFAISKAALNKKSKADYTNFTLGYGYRPVHNDKLNGLIKYSYLTELASPGQLTSSRTSFANDYEQKSHVFNIDSIYDLTPKLSIGAKFGYRFGQIRDTTIQNPRWFGSRAWLAIFRADWHIVHEWDITIEWRTLKVLEAQDVKRGALLGVYRHIDENAKIGIGYNFTNFSDDLTNLNYRNKGFFINVIAKF